MYTGVISVLAAVDTFGALIGAGMTTFAEVFYTYAVSDDNIDHHERKYLRRLFRGFTFGISLVLFSNLALIVLEYLVPGAPQAVLAAPFWALQTLALLIILMGLLLSRRRLSWWLGSAGVLSAWWLVLLIDLGYLNGLGYVTILFLFILVTVVLAGVLGYLRFLMKRLEPLPLESH